MANPVRIYTPTKFVGYVHYRKPGQFLKRSKFKERYVVVDPTLSQIQVFGQDTDLFSGKKPKNVVQLGNHVTKVSSHKKSPLVSSP